MAVKDLVEKRKDILFAEIGALIHDLGKLSKEFVIQTTEGSVYDHSLILGRDYRNNILKNYGKSDKDLNKIIQRLNELRENLSSKKINEILENELNSVLNGLSKREKRRKINEFLLLLKSKCSNSSIQDTLDFLSTFNISGNLYLSDIISKHHNNEKFNLNTLTEIDNNHLNLLRSAADGIDSAIDKMVTNHDIAKQSKDNAYISTAFGYENQKIDLSLPDTTEKSLTKIRNDYADTLALILEGSKNNPDDIQNLIEKREAVLRDTREAFLKALGETRRPANDVTLWDHSFSVASLYKSALAEVIINGWKEPKEIKWKLLGIRFDGNDFYNAVPKIADVLGRKALVQKILDNIKILLEAIIPIGNEIYRDENGSVFLVTESCEDNKILEINDLWDSIKNIELEVDLDYIGNWNKKTIDRIASKRGISNPSGIKELIEKLSSYMSEGIFIPQITLSESSRGALNLGIVTSETQKHRIDLEKLKEKWQGKEEGYGKCTVCNLKPIPLKPEEYEELKNKEWENLTEEEKNNVKAYERKECLDCLKLSTNRVEEWYKNEKWNSENPEKPSFNTSIWLDEIADVNNRIGLIYIKFDLEKWLNGEMLNTFFSNPLLEEEFKKQFENELFNVPDYNKLIELLEEAFNVNNFDAELSVFKKDGATKLKVKELFQILVGVVRDNSPEELFQSIVENREPDWKENYPISEGSNKGDNKHKTMVFLLHTTRKHPSFARLRRIWETTKNFGIDMFNKAREMLGKKKRTVFEFNNSLNLKITHTYYFKDNNDNKGEMVILNNKKASVISASKELKLKNGDSLEIYMDKYFKDKLGNLTTKNGSLNPEPFKPIIPYQFEPSNTIFFVPLKDKTWEIINEIKKQYEIQFNKVQNRLPIKIGFVAFHKQTPMYAVLDAAKRLMELKNTYYETAEICEITEMGAEENCNLYDGKIGNKVKKIVFNNGETYYFSYSTGDPNKEDLFHPYFVVQNNNGWKVPLSKQISGQNNDKEWKTIKHVKHLQKGDKVEFYPSNFDFLYLDTNTRRLDAGKDRKHWLFEKKSPKPYRLKKIEEFNNLRSLLIDKLKLTSSQLLNAYGMLIDKLQNWELDKTDTFPIKDNIFTGFIESVILSNPFRLKVKNENGKGQIKEKDFGFLKNTMLNGVFFDFIDMWHTVLKRKFKED